MKKIITITICSLLFALSLNAALTFEVTITGSPSEADKLAAIDQIDKENARRAALETPLPPLPYGTLQELAASTEMLYAQVIANAHANYVAQAAEADLNDLKAQLDVLWKDATASDRQAAIAAAIAALTP